MLRALLFLITFNYVAIKYLFPNSKAFALINDFHQYTSIEFEKIGNASIEDARPFFKTFYLSFGITCLILFSLLLKVYGENHKWLQNGDLFVITHILVWVVYGFISKEKFNDVVKKSYQKLIKGLKIQAIICFPLILILVFVLSYFYQKDLYQVITHPTSLSLIGAILAFPTATILAWLIMILFISVMKYTSDLFIWIMIKLVRFSKLKDPTKPIDFILFFISSIIGIWTLIDNLVP